jgi:hypothetical protein
MIGFFSVDSKNRLLTLLMSGNGGSIKQEKPYADSSFYRVKI